MPASADAAIAAFRTFLSRGPPPGLRSSLGQGGSREKSKDVWSRSSVRFCPVSLLWPPIPSFSAVPTSSRPWGTARPSTTSPRTRSRPASSARGSKAFTGRVAFKGMPLATETPGQLGGRRHGHRAARRRRLRRSRASPETRVQFKALSLVSIAPIKTGCGAFHVYVSLGGRQRVTAMKILPDPGGRRDLRCAPGRRCAHGVHPGETGAERPRAGWSSRGASPSRPTRFRGASRGGEMTKRFGEAVVDTNGDLAPDTGFPAPRTSCPARMPGQSMNKACLPRVRVPCGVQRQRALLLVRSPPRVLGSGVHLRRLAGSGGRAPLTAGRAPRSPRWS